MTIPGVQKRNSPREPLRAHERESRPGRLAPGASGWRSRRPVDPPEILAMRRPTGLPSVPASLLRPTLVLLRHVLKCADHGAGGRASTRRHRPPLDREGEHRLLNPRPGRSPMAGFQLSIIGRIWGVHRGRAPRTRVRADARHEAAVRAHAERASRRRCQRAAVGCARSRSVIAGNDTS